MVLTWIAVVYLILSGHVIPNDAGLLDIFLNPNSGDGSSTDYQNDGQYNPDNNNYITPSVVRTLGYNPSLIGNRNDFFINPSYPGYTANKNSIGTGQNKPNYNGLQNQLLEAQKLLDEYKKKQKQQNGGLTANKLPTGYPNGGVNPNNVNGGYNPNGQIPSTSDNGGISVDGGFGGGPINHGPSDVGFGGGPINHIPSNGGFGGGPINHVPSDGGFGGGPINHVPSNGGFGGGPINNVPSDVGFGGGPINHVPSDGGFGGGPINHVPSDGGFGGGPINNVPSDVGFGGGPINNVPSDVGFGGGPIDHVPSTDNGGKPNSSNNQNTGSGDNNRIKSLTAKKFFFQVQPVMPESERKDKPETVYYIE